MQLFGLKNRKAIAIVYPEPILSTVPGLCNFIEKIAEHHFQVDIYTTISDQYELPYFNNSNVHLHQLNHPKWFKRKFPLTFIPSNLILKSFLFFNSLTKYNLIIGVDPAGIVAASENNPLNIPLAYFSLELLIDGELDSKEKALRSKEIAALKKTRYLLISDEERKEIFLRYNPEFQGKIIYIPNASANTEEPLTDLHFPKNKVLVNVSGSTAAWTGIDRIIESSKTWEDNYLLVIHCKSEEEKIILAQRNPGILENEEIFLTYGSFKRSQYKNFISKMDIGIVFYIPQFTDRYDGLNLRYIGKSSGKFAYYLMSGKPVIVNDVPYYRHLLQRYRFGVLIKDTHDKGEIAKALTTIHANYSTYSKEALRCFQNEFDLDQAVSDFVKALQQ